MEENLDFISKVKLFNKIAGTKEEFDPRKASLYVGLILEEVAEMFESFNVTTEEWTAAIEYLHNFGTEFKSGNYDYVMDNVDRIEFLDAAIDISVVSLGAGISIGGDVEKACHAVADNNLEKYPIIGGERIVLKDENGKIKKPDGFKSVDLKDCLY